jgi:Rrf2 family protein
MLRFSKQVDYGIQILAVCAGEPRSQIHSTRELAERTGLPVPMVSKILKGLARGGILESYRGKGGGYSVLRAPGEMSVASVVIALEGPVRLVDCSSGSPGDNGGCRQRGRCRTGAPMRALSVAFRRMLEEMTFEELIRLPEEACPSEKEGFPDTTFAGTPVTGPSDPGEHPGEHRSEDPA